MAKAPLIPDNTDPSTMTNNHVASAVNHVLEHFNGDAKHLGRVYSAFNKATIGITRKTDTTTDNVPENQEQKQP